MCNQIVARFSTGHLLHDTDELRLHLSLARRLRDTDGPNLSHPRHVYIAVQNLVKEFNGDDLRVLSRQKPLLPKHELVKRVKVREECINSVFEGHLMF